MPYATRLLSCLSCLFVTLAYCGQGVGWIKVPVSTEVGICPCDIRLDGDLALPGKEAQQPLTTFRFRPMSIVAKRLSISATAELLLSYASGQTYRHTHRNILHTHRKRSNYFLSNKVAQNSGFPRKYSIHLGRCFLCAYANANAYTVLLIRILFLRHEIYRVRKNCQTAG